MSVSVAMAASQHADVHGAVGATFALRLPITYTVQLGKVTGGHVCTSLHSRVAFSTAQSCYTRAGTLIVASIYLQLIQNRYMFRSFTVLQCSHQHCVQPVASDVEVVGYL